MQKQSRNTVLAMVGKGGVGKTSLSAIMVRLLSEAHPQGRILAIDADPAVGLATALGIEPRFTVDDIRKEFIQTVEGGEAKAAVEMFTGLYENRDDNFGNGRDVRNCFEDMIVRQSNRVAAMEAPTREDLMAVMPEDLRDAEEEAASVDESAEASDKPEA